MLQIRKFGPEIKTTFPNPDLKEMSGVIVQLDKEVAAKFSPEEMERRYNGLPILLDRSNSVVVLYFDPHGEMPTHPAGEPVLFMVLSGSGFVRIGGESGETVHMNAGEAVLWPANVLHKVWTEDQPLQALLIHYSKT